MRLLEFGRRGRRRRRYQQHNDGVGWQQQPTTGAGGATGTSGSVQTCTGQIAEAEPYYAINNGNLELGGFAVDSQGMAFVAIPDIVQIVDGDKLRMYPSFIEAGTLDGNVHTIYTPDKGALMGGLSMDDTSVYFSRAGILGAVPPGIFSIPRSGGQPTAIYQGRVDSGPVTDGTNFYFLGSIRSSSPSAESRSARQMSGMPSVAAYTKRRFKPANRLPG